MVEGLSMIDNMEVANYKAYRIVDTEQGAKYKVNDVLPIEHYNTDDYSSNKKAIEQILEEIRPDALPSRNKALFVFPESEHDYESVWTNFKYNHNEKEYLLFELELTGKLYWLNADTYNKGIALQNIFPEEAEKLIKAYWVEIQESDFTDNMDIEGLFTGTAIIKKIVRKKHLPNGENVEID